MTGRKLGVAGSNPVGGANIPRGDEMSKEKFIRVCPFCGSIDVSHEQNPSYIIQATALGGFQCNDCGHHGLFPEVPTSEIPGLKSERVDNPVAYRASRLHHDKRAINISRGFKKHGKENDEEAQEVSQQVQQDEKAQEAQVTRFSQGFIS